MEDFMSPTAENLIENATTKPPSTPEGFAIAFGSLVLMAIFAVHFGCLRSVNYHKENKPERITSGDVAMFPIMASCVLFCLYVSLHKEDTKENINLILTLCFCNMGVLALTRLLSSICNTIVPSAIPNIPFHILFQKGKGDNTKDIINYKFSSYDIISLICCIPVGVWYLLENHWIANNLFGFAFAIKAIESVHLNNVFAGCTLLSGLFLYDIFWVFGTDVMVTIALSIEAPIKLVFPQDLLLNGLAASKFAMLGLGDIVVPGIFIALMLRFDKSLQRKTSTYFYATCFAYFLGLMTTILMLHIFKHGQPALLYLVPACLGTPVLLALIKGDIKALFRYEEAPEEDEEEEEETEEAKKIK